MQPTLKFTLAAIATFGLAAASGSAFAQTKLKWAHVYETSESYHIWALWAAGEIAKRTSNRYTIDVFPASQLGNETQLNQSLPLGTVEERLGELRALGPLHLICAVGGRSMRAAVFLDAAGIECTNIAEEPRPGSRRVGRS